ncbi:PAS domain S-box protein [Methanobacterium oryzae]|uniref:PAS domain S-box protein n=1 Tax=Methanobacterium oryzae TaxID=69540 RepID=UPI003D1D31FA
MEEHKGQFKEIFEKSPIGILFYDKKGELIKANQSALEIIGIPSLNILKEVNLFENSHIKSHKEELFKNKYIRFQIPVNLDKIKEQYNYPLKKSGLIYIDYTVSVTDSGFLAQIQDITEQKKDEIARIESERKFRTLLDMLPVGISVLGNDRKILFNNSALEEILELSKDEINKGKYIERKYIKSDMSEMNFNDIPSVKAFNEQKPVKDIEVGIMKGNKSTIWTNVSAIPLSFPDWNILAVTSDITKRKKAEEELNNNLIELETILSSIADGIVVYNASGEIIRINNVAKKVLGYKENVPKISFEERASIALYPNGEQFMFEDLPANRALNGETIRDSEMLIKRGSNNYTWVIASAAPIIGENKEINGAVSTFKDITKRKKAEEELRKNELRFRSVLDNSLDAIYRVNLKTGHYEYFSPAFEDVFGFSAEELMSQTPEQAMSLIHPDDISLVKESLSQLDKTGNVKVEYRVRDSSGKYRWLSNHLSQIKDDKGRPMYRDGTVRNITQKKKNEEELRKSRHNLELKVQERTKEIKYQADLLKNVNDAILSANKDYIITSWNPAAERQYGWKADEAIGKNVFELLQVEYPDKEFSEALETIVKSGGYKGEEIHQRKDGTSIIVETTVMGLRDKKDDITGWVSVIRDINERKKTEEELRMSRENFRTLAENSLDSIIRLDKDLRYVYVNSAAAEITGKSPEDFIGKTYREVGIPEEYASLWTENNRKAIETGKIQHYEFEFMSNNDLRFIESTAIPEFNAAGEIESVLILDRDITEHKNIEDELRRSRTSFKTLAENSPDIINRIDKEFKTVYINPAIIEISGKPPEHFIGKNMDKLGIPEEFTVPLKEKSIKAFKTGEIQEFKTEMPTAKGLKIFYTYLAPEFDENGKVNTVFTVSHDITELKHAEKHLKETIQELERSNIELQQFAYVSSHDLQEPLRTIASFTQLLERRYKGKFDSDADEFMDYIVEAAIRMKEQIEGLLEYSRVATKGEEFKPVDINIILNQTIKILHTSIKESNAIITHDELPNVKGDADQLQRVFQNLISNAIKFRKSEEPLKIHISARKENNEYIFSISDNGIGIEEQYSERIFTIFQRLHTREKYKGTGIGLSIVKRIIERHGGRIWVESSFGVGSTFYFTIPKLMKE